MFSFSASTGSPISAIASSASNSNFREHTTEWTNCVFISTLCYCCCHIVRFYEVEKSSLLCSLQFDSAVDIRGILSSHRRQHQCNLSINEALKIVGRVELEQHYQVRCRCTHRLDFIHFQRKRGWKTKSEIREKLSADFCVAHLRDYREYKRVIQFKKS